MYSAYTDSELRDWLRAVSENGSGFLRTIAEAAFLADLPHYAILRPALVKLKEFEFRLAASSGVLDGELEQDKSHDPSGPRIQ